MIAPWVDEHNDPDYPTLRKIGSTHVFRSLRDPKTTRSALLADKAAGFATGVYIVSSWYPNLSPRAVADLGNQLLKSVDGGTPSDPVVCWDVETKDVPYVRTLFRRWKSHRPTRVTDWTLEGHQGGIFKPADVAELLKTVDRYWVPQCYNGAMTEVWDTLAMARDLTAIGVPDSRIVPFLDAAHIPAWATGYVFTQGRIP